MRSYLPTAEITIFRHSTLVCTGGFFLGGGLLLRGIKALLRLTLASGHSHIHVMELVCFQSCTRVWYIRLCAGSINQMDCNLFSGNCYISGFSLYSL